MFSVYGVTGQVFNGTLEEMMRVRGLTRSRSSRLIDREDINWQVDHLGTAANRPSPGAH